MIRILMVGPIQVSGGVAMHTRYLTDQLMRLGAKIILYNLAENKNNIYIIRSINVMFRRTLGLFFESIIKMKDYDIIHIQASGGMSSFISAITGSFVSLLIHKNLIITFHYSETDKFIHKYRYIFSWVLKNVNQLILVSHSQEKAIISIFGDSKKIHVLPNGFDHKIMRPLSISSARDKLGLPENIKLMITIGALERYKGHEYLIEAMKYVSLKDKLSKLYIIGEGSLKNYLQSLINEYSLNNRVLLSGGNKPIEDIPQWINACDIFVLPSLNEGNPLVMFEALACGKPLIGTNVGAIPEIISGDKLGILVEPGDAINLAKAILSGLNGNWDREYIINYADQFSWGKIAEKTLKIYESNRS